MQVIYAPRYHDDPHIQEAALDFVLARSNPFSPRRQFVEVLGSCTVEEFRARIARAYGPAAARGIRITLQ